MNSEDKMFLLNALIAVGSSNKDKCDFVLDKGNCDRLTKIRNSLSREEFDSEIAKLKQVVGN